MSIHISFDFDPSKAESCVKQVEFLQALIKASVGVSVQPPVEMPAAKAAEKKAAPKAVEKKIAVAESIEVNEVESAKVANQPARPPAEPKVKDNPFAIPGVEKKSNAAADFEVSQDSAPQAKKESDSFKVFTAKYYALAPEAKLSALIKIISTTYDEDPKATNDVYKLIKQFRDGLGVSRIAEASEEQLNKIFEYTKTVCPNTAYGVLL